MLHSIIVGVISGATVGLMAAAAVSFGGERLGDGLLHVEDGGSSKVDWPVIGQTAWRLAIVLVPAGAVVGVIIGAISAAI